MGFCCRRYGRRLPHGDGCVERYLCPVAGAGGLHRVLSSPLHVILASLPSAAPPWQVLDNLRAEGKAVNPCTGFWLERGPANGHVNRGNTGGHPTTAPVNNVSTVCLRTSSMSDSSCSGFYDRGSASSLEVLIKADANVLSAGPYLCSAGSVHVLLATEVTKISQRQSFTVFACSDPTAPTM